LTEARSLDTARGAELEGTRRFTTESTEDTEVLSEAKLRESLLGILGGESLTAKTPSRQEAKAVASPQVGFSVSSVLSVVNLTFFPRHGC